MLPKAVAAATSWKPAAVQRWDELERVRLQERRDGHVTCAHGRETGKVTQRLQPYSSQFQTVVAYPACPCSAQVVLEFLRGLPATPPLYDPYEPSPYGASSKNSMYVQ
jgi:hypothetical protein